MKRINSNILNFGVVLFLVLFTTLQAQDRIRSQEVRWLRVGDLHSTFAIEGAEFEMHRTGNETEQCDGMRWPAQFKYQDNSAAKSMWIGTTNFHDHTTDLTYPHKVVGVGPRQVNPLNEVMPYDFKMVGKAYSPIVVVDGITATNMKLNDVVDEIDENLPCDRMIVQKLHTSIGVDVTRKVMAFSQQNHDDYFIYDITFKNTGIVDLDGTVIDRTLTDVIFHFQYRYGLSKEGTTKLATPSNGGWGRNCVNHVIGRDPNAADFEMRAAYSWYGRHSESAHNDVGGPDYRNDGVLTAARYAGIVTLHADKSVSDSSDDPSQPKTTRFLGSDTDAQSLNQYDAQYMTRKYEVMSGGHDEQTHAEQVGGIENYADQYGSDSGGYAQGRGFGPYTMAPGDSIRIVFAEGLNGLDRQKCFDIGAKWLNDTKPFVKPDGSEAANRDEYKNSWVVTGEDSIKQVLKRALANYQAQYNIPQPPPAPETFEVNSGGNKIVLSWASNAETAPNFNGYEVYRAIATPDTFYQKIFECDASNVVNTFEDVTARRGFNYYYYVVSKDDGSTNDVYAGEPLRSSKYYTMTNEPAYLRRPAGTNMDEIRVVPNPFNIRSREMQFGLEAPDRIAFFGIPKECTIRIYTERGDLIKVIEHTDGSGDELWDCTTSSNQIIVSGLYIAHIETPEGESTFRKFIVIR